MRGAKWHFPKSLTSQSRSRDISVPEAMGGTCKGCAKWEEEIYWNHFSSNSFIQFLSADFHHHLAIPTKFSTNLRKELLDKVELRSPSGARWNIGLEQNDGNLFFTTGWAEFVQHHSLRENDILTFTYNRGSCFNVLMFDRQSLCEKETSYFVRRHECRCSSKRKERENPIDVTHNSSHEPDDCASSADDDAVISRVLNTKLQSKLLRSCSTSTGATKFKPSTNGSNARVHYVSNRRPVTEAEKENALELAVAEAIDESFMVVLQPSHVYKGFYLAIPRKWMLKHLNPKIQSATLRVEGRTWDVKYYYNHSRVIGRFTSGWKSFVVENNLEESDVCVFKVCSVGHNSVTVDVSIFRVVQDAVPPRLVVPGSVGEKG